MACKNENKKRIHNITGGQKLWQIKKWKWKMVKHLTKLLIEEYDGKMVIVTGVQGDFAYMS